MVCEAIPPQFGHGEGCSNKKAFEHRIMYLIVAMRRRLTPKA
jgi:hypothetical protein